MTPEELRRLAAATLRAKQIAEAYSKHIKLSLQPKITLEQSNKMLTDALARAKQ